MRRNLQYVPRNLTAVGCALAIGAVLSVANVGAAQSSASSKSLSKSDMATKDQTTKAQTVTAGDLADHPDRFIGQRVTVTAPVEDVFSRSTFTLDEDKVWSTGRDVLVLNPRPVGHVTNSADVTVTGKVYRFTRTEIERMYSPWAWDISPELIIGFEQRPVLIANSIETQSGQQLVRAMDHAGKDTAVASRTDSAETNESERKHIASAANERDDTTEGSRRAAAIVSAGNLADHPDRYYGRTVSVTADVEDIYSRSVFALDEDKVWSTGQDVLVVASNLKKAVDDDMYVTVIGEVVRFDETEIERRVHGYAFDLRPDLMGRLNDRPVILATSVRTAEGEELLETQKGT